LQKAFHLITSTDEGISTDEVICIAEIEKSASNDCLMKKIISFNDVHPKKPDHLIISTDERISI
jgi:hypothetical protein